VIGCFKKCVRIVEERIIYLFVMFIQDMYERVRPRIGMLGRDLRDLLVDIRLYRGLALSPFTIILDEFTNDM